MEPFDPNDRILPRVEIRRPRCTVFTLRAGRSFPFPINRELADIIGLLLLSWPGDIRPDRAHELDVKIWATLNEEFRIPIAGVDARCVG